MHPGLRGFPDPEGRSWVCLGPHMKREGRLPAQDFVRPCAMKEDS